MNSSIFFDYYRRKILLNRLSEKTEWKTFNENSTTSKIKRITWFHNIKVSISSTLNPLNEKD